MPVNYEIPPHWKNNLMAAIDFETTGVRPGFHEIIQVAIVPLDYRFEPIAGIKAFYKRVKPEHPERAEPLAMKTNQLKLDDPAITKEKCIDELQRWWDKLDLPFGGRLIPLSHNAAFELDHLKQFLGYDHFEKLFHFHPRCAMQEALAINEKCFKRGKKPMFERVGLEYLAEYFGIPNVKKHDALNDCLVEAMLYPRLLDVDVL